MVSSKVNGTYSCQVQQINKEIANRAQKKDNMNSQIEKQASNSKAQISQPKKNEKKKEKLPSFLEFRLLSKMQAV